MNTICDGNQAMTKSQTSQNMLLVKAFMRDCTNIFTYLLMSTNFYSLFHKPRASNPKNKPKQKM